MAADSRKIGFMLKCHLSVFEPGRFLIFLGGNMSETIIQQSIRLVYPPALVNVPIIYQLIRNHDLNVNILRAHITEEEGWIDLQIAATLPVTEKAFSWLRSQGIEIQSIQA
jgi:hypothetical protein